MRLKHIALAVLSATFLAGVAVAPAVAADKIQIKFTTVSVPTDWHTKAMKVFKDTLDNLEPGVFDIQLYDSGALFGQGADLDAVQRGNAEMAYISFQQIADAIPQFSLMTSGYLFQSPDHLRLFFNSAIGQQFRQKVSSDMGIHLLDICYLGTREVDLRTVRDVKTPADLAGVKMRMPGSDAWLFLGKALGANPTPLPFGEVYLGLQTGTIDGQDNPLPTDYAAKFYEVTKQIVMTDHLVDAVMPMMGNQVWDKLSDVEKADVTTAATSACDYNNAGRIADEQRLLAFFKSKGMTITIPDKAAFRKHVQEAYLQSSFAANWPKGWLDKINAMAPPEAVPTPLK